jgi:3D (Asp-Asp-Asp) domain-containing protein
MITKWLLFNLIFLIPLPIQKTEIKDYLINLSVVATAYSPRKKETDNTPFITATGKKVFKNGIAVSRILEEKLPMGSSVWINNKIYIVNDRMNKKWKDKRIDIFFFDTQKALKFGKRKIIIKFLKNEK